MKYVIGVLIFVALLAGLLLLGNRPVRVPIVAKPPSGFPRNDFSHDIFESLLEQYVDSVGNIDYDAWHQSESAVADLDSYLAAVSHYSPENSPQRFPSESARLAYWIYGYNAYVVRSVVHNWPIDSVTDLKAPLEVVTGLGFFHRLRFSFGGEFYSLLHVENSIIRKRFRDPRIHFVLNCASESCPPMRPVLPTGDELETLLSESARDFITDPQYVSVDHPSKQIYLSTIFKWFKKDFLNDLRKRGLPAERGVVDYIASIAPESLREQLDAASDYEVVFRDYDWTLNVVTESK